MTIAEPKDNILRRNKDKIILKGGFVFYVGQNKAIN